MATFDEETNTLIIDDDENDRWIRTLPEYTGEIALHDELSKKLNPQKLKVVRKKKSNDGT